ncbi:MAG: bi-domain-containing oxidoreductase [Rhodospirillales bacterium]|nr:bi-domain-containing oxidoreductase [Rhodospirillales bacterium]
MKQVLLKQGGVVVEEVPAPRAEKGTVLVRVGYSCISVGTEMSGVRATSAPLWKRALQKPSDVKKVLDRLLSNGLSETSELVRRKLQTAYPIGYSASGKVIAVGEGVEDICVGARVACAGSQAAHHAEVIAVPRNLVVEVPDNIEMDKASTVTLGAIALQGVRRAKPTLGETFIVLGLGIIGQLTQQILQANGVHVIGVDLDADRVRRACDNGLKHGCSDAGHEMINAAYRLSNGYGADGAIITAATSSSELLANAFKSCRRKGRVVLVGDVGMDIDREDIYAKELDFLISTSYGPGRYDRLYEEKGMEYPLPYVRWTENRNMSAFLDLIADGRVSLDNLVSERCELQKAPDAYESLQSGTKRPLSILLTYDERERELRHSVSIGSRKALRRDTVHVAVVGAGGFATSTLMPIMRGNSDFQISAVVTRQGYTATNVARQFDVPEASTDFSAVLRNPQIDAVVIATRHDLHGEMVLAALKAGKHVMVEKPLCLTEKEADAIENYFAVGGQKENVLMVGFNRRFSPFVATIHKELIDRTSPMIINYRVNAGFIPREHWVHGSEGGGRNIGEACHFYDLFTALTGSEVRSVTAQSIVPKTRHYCRTDNFCMAATFADGSVANLTYTSLGDSSHPKERMTIFAEGRVIDLEDFRTLHGTGTKFSPLTTRKMEKGHREEIAAFGKAVLNGIDWPIPMWQQLQATRIALNVQSQIVSKNEGVI